MRLAIISSHDDFFGCGYVVVCVIKRSVLYCLCYINRETKKILLKDKN